MGYYIETRGSDIRVRESLRDELLHLLDEFVAGGDRSWLPEKVEPDAPPDVRIAAILGVFGWETREPEPSWCLSSLWGDGEKWYDEKFDLLCAIAPVVEPGSWIECEGEGDLWRWYFTGDAVEQVAGEVIFPGHHALHLLKEPEAVSLGAARGPDVAAKVRDLLG